MRLARRSLLVVLLTAVAVSAQPTTRRAANIAALLANPAFYHMRPVVIVGEVKLADSGELRVSSEAGSLPLIVAGGNAPDGLDEIRGEFWDLGRMNADDPRLAGYDVRRTFKIDPEGAWPRPGQVTAIVASSVTAASPPAAPSIRNIVLYPSRYLDQTVTIVGQFGGRNLLGDLADAPAQSRYDFVLRSADAAIWVSNIRPRGRDFELALDARIDTGRWVEVSGTLQQGRGLQWLNAQAGSLRLAQPPKESTENLEPIRVPAAPPPEVIFSTPLDDETDVALGTTLRIQFSRDIDPATIRGHVKVAYADSDRQPDGPTTTPLEFTTQYMPGTRVLEIRFSQPFDRFRTVSVELTNEVIGTDKQALVPWKATFRTGGR
jgi:hypothetical protein